MRRTSTTACSRRPIPRARSSWRMRRPRGSSLSPSALGCERMRATLILLCLLPAFPAFAGGEKPISRPHSGQTDGVRSVSATLVGVARVASDALDSQGETLGGFGSGMMLVPQSWHRAGHGFAARLDMLPDRGWNTAGTVDFRARVQKFDLSLVPDDGAPGHEGQLKLAFK